MKRSGFLWDVAFLAILGLLMVFLLLSAAALLRGEVPRQTAIVSGIFFILGYLSCLYLSRLISRGLPKLTQERRDSNQHALPQELIEDLRLSREAAKRWSEELEKRVEERTRKIIALRRRLIHSEKMASLGTMAAGVAHEIRNPLGIIGTAAGVLKSSVSAESNSLGKDDMAFLREQIAIIEEETFRIGRIAANLLSFSQSSLDGVPQSVHINDVIYESVACLQGTALSGIELLQNLDRSLPPVRIDREQLRQVFLNIIQNASQAMPDGGTIEISSRRSSQRGMVEASFRDTGCGISPKDLKRIFDPFFTARATKKGFGLGLAISHNIIYRAKGEIDVQSTPGKGTTFTIKLPTTQECRGNGEME
jgi:two-component system NtrC family sensor kinase